MFGKRVGVAFSAAVAVALIGLASWMLPASPGHAQDAPPPLPLPDGGPANPQGGDARGHEVLTNGPVHEAYAEPTALNPAPPMVIPTQPPAPVEELPPDVKPDGQNVVWIPGYWAWDDGRKDFIWVSGIWRDTPPNHAWVAGYWSPAGGGGFQWTPGIWAPSNVEQVNYVPQPPQSLENGPNTPAPTANDFWVPGTYEYVDARYVWRAGYWTAAQPDWIWIAAHYVWTPSGYLFIPGHWDYELSHRGVLFAPVAFDGTYWAGRPIVYGPRVVIDPGVLTVDFFVRPNYYHYYFGDCYGPAYVGWGFHPWFGVGIGYDPLFTYYRWYNVRRDPDWDRRAHERFVYMDRHPEARPPRTYAMSIRAGGPGGVHIGISLNEYARRPGPTHFQTVSMAQRQEFAHEAVRSNEVARQRAIAESHGGRRPGEGARSLDMHALSQHSGGHLPGAEHGAMADREREAGRDREPSRDRGFENHGAGNTARTGPTTGPGATPFHPAGPTSGTTKPGTIPGQPTRTGALPGRTPPPPPDSKKKGDERGSGGGRFLIQPNDDQANSTGKAPADATATRDSPSLSTFGGFAPRNAANPLDTAADQNGSGALQPINGKDPIRPLIVSPELSPQLSQFGSNAGSFARGPAVNGVSPLFADPTARDVTKDPIRPMIVLPPTSLPLGNSRSGLPSSPGNPAGAVSQQKDPIRPIRLPNGT